METFTLTEAHLKLLDNLYIRFDDGMYDGVASGDIKYPYGDSMIMDSVAKIIGVRPDDGQDLDEPLTSKEEKICRKAHEETATALQIVLHTKRFLPGKYRLKDHRWALKP